MKFAEFSLGENKKAGVGRLLFFRVRSFSRVQIFV